MPVTRHNCNADMQGKISMNQSFTIEQVSWDNHKQALLKAVREVVFIEEQHVPLYIEWDEFDQDAIHLLALDAFGKAIGCARILKKAELGAWQ